jgi:integrase/recombinase XerD
MGRFTIYSRENLYHYQRFMKYLEAIGYSLASQKTFDTGIREFLWWLEKKKITTVGQVEESDIKSFYTYQQERPRSITGGPLSESRVAIHMYTLKLFFQYFIDTEQLEVNPMSNLNYGRDYKRIRENLLSHRDIGKLYDECHTARQRAMLAMFYGCGLRREEAVKLNVKDVHFRNAMLYVRQGKGGRKRTIPINGKVLEDLKEYYYNQRPGEINYNNDDGKEAFMLNKRGVRMKALTYTEDIKKLIRKAGLSESISLHHFRHAIATHLLESGMKTGHVKDFLGHMSIETTQTYTHITATQMKKTTAYGIETISA